MRPALIFALPILLLIAGCGGGGSEDPFEALQGLWSGTYSTSGAIPEVKMEISGQEVLSFVETGGGATAGDVIHDGGASYRLALDSGLTIRIHLHVTRTAFSMVYEDGGEFFVGLMEAGDIARPAGGFFVSDLSLSAWSGNGSRYNASLDLTRAFAASMQFGGTSVMSGNVGGAIVDSDGSSAMISDSDVGSWVVSVDNLFPATGIAILLMSPSKRYILVAAAPAAIVPDVDDAFFMIMENTSV